MPFMQVTLIEGRTPERKERLIGELTETAVRVLDVPIETVRVSINEVPEAHWGVAGISKAKRREQEEAQ